jgi:hypothetical protein
MMGTSPNGPATRAPDRRVTAARATLIVGLLLGGLGLGRLAYFTFWFDTWVMQHVPAPPGVDVAFEEAVLVPSDELEAQARAGTAAAWRLAIIGGAASTAGVAALRWSRRRPDQP